jgi:GTP-binding protein
VGPSERQNSEDRLEAGRLLFAGPCTFLRGVVDEAGLPPPALPEVAFAGRSNVGKSSLINALTGRKTLARVSNTPGRTQEINLFDLGGRLILVDLPGYGYAEAPHAKVKAWTGLIKLYLKGRVPLRRVCLLVDSRVGIKKADDEIMAMLDESAVIYQVILTKIDKLSAKELAARTDEVAAALKKHPAAFPALLPTSAEKGTGIPELRAALAEVAAG